MGLKKGRLSEEAPRSLLTTGRPYRRQHGRAVDLPSVTLRAQHCHLNAKPLLLRSKARARSPHTPTVTKTNCRPTEKTTATGSASARVTALLGGEETAE